MDTDLPPPAGQPGLPRTPEPPYGWFEGRIHTDDVDLSVDGMFGVGEQKLIRV